MFNDDKVSHEHAGEHVEGHTRQMEEERRKQSNFGMFRQDSNGSPTRLHEDMRGRDRNK
jgi:hypothetical protein